MSTRAERQTIAKALYRKRLRDAKAVIVRDGPINFASLTLAEYRDIEPMLTRPLTLSQPWINGASRLPLERVRNIRIGGIDNVFDPAR